jgi:hypothetical protein
MTYSISLSGTGSCGGTDFSRAHLKEDGFSAGKAGDYGVEKSRYALDNKIFSKPLRVRRYSEAVEKTHFSLS